MKKLFLRTFISAVCVLFLSAPVLAEEEIMATLTGSIQGVSCVVMKEVCPIGMEDAMAAEEDYFVFLVNPITADYYVMPNVDMRVLARHINEQVTVVGNVDKKHNSIWTKEIYVGKKMVWSKKMQDELRKKMSGNLKK
jgi:hypothetical protein